MRINFLITLLFFSQFSLSGYQEADTTNKLSLQLIQGGLLSTGDTAPFWFTANNSQRISEEPFSTWTRLLLKKDLRDNKNIDWGYGLDLIGRYDGDWSGDFTQVYIQAKNKYFNAFIGRKEEQLGVVDSTLSIGTLVNGNNALPVPKIAIRTNGWLNFPFTKDWVQFNGYYSHGWFEKDRFIQNALLHQKYLYLNVGGKWPINAYSGIIWSTQWGGRRSDNGEKQPSSFADYLRVITGSAGDSGASQSDQNNALGNHLGVWDIGIKAKLNKWQLMYYFQFLWEDKSGLTPFNWRDGMMGISMKRKNKDHWFTGANIEIVRTNDQNAQKVGSDGIPFLEPDDFLNNSQYPSGWSYQDVVIGNPIFLLTNINGSFRNSISGLINAVNIGLEGKVSRKKISYQLKYMYFKNQGRHRERFSEPFELSSLSLYCQYDFSQDSSIRLKLNHQSGSKSDSFGVMFEYRFFITRW